MSKRRTKQERLQAKIRRVSLPRRSETVKLAESTVEVKPTVAKLSAKFFSQDPNLIKKDLKKTLIVTSLVLLVLFTISLLYT